ncbi:hypothetical protein GCM10027294_43930 [Marinactinospora endophytica]
MSDCKTTSLRKAGSGGGSPFDQIRHEDKYGREYWTGRELQPLMEYSQWRDFAAVIIKAKDALALVEGSEQAEQNFAETRKVSGARGPASADFHLSRLGAYLTAMAGDDTKQAVAEARVYFAVRAREAELHRLSQAEIRQTALARAREMIDYATFRDMMAENATDYEPSSHETRKFFGAMQNQLYRHLTGMDANQLKAARKLYHWPGREKGKEEPSPKSPHRKIAKNYLTVNELQKLNRLVGRLCLRAEDIAEDGVHLSMARWSQLVDDELRLLARPLAS